MCRMNQHLCHHNEGNDCLTWCYFFVPYFGDWKCMLGLISVCIFFSLLNRNTAIVSFSFGMFNIVFWILTYCQCPFPCDQYEGMCQEAEDGRYFLCWDLLLVWTRPGISVCGLAVSLSLQNCVLPSSRERRPAAKTPPEPSQSESPAHKSGNNKTPVMTVTLV